MLGSCAKNLSIYLPLPHFWGAIFNIFSSDKQEAVAAGKENTPEGGVYFVLYVFVAFAVFYSMFT
jgi:hypothetical protein